MPGLGRMAICLSDQIKEQGKDGYSGRNVSKECSQELDKFRKDQSGNINLDLPLGMFPCYCQNAVARYLQPTTRHDKSSLTTVLKLIDALESHLL